MTSTHVIVVAIEAVDEKNFGLEVTVSRITKVLDQLPPTMSWTIQEGEGHTRNSPPVLTRSHGDEGAESNA